MSVFGDTGLSAEDLDRAVVSVLQQIEPTLDPPTLLDAFHTIGRTKMRRRTLSDAVLADPAILTSGAPTGPLIVSQLINHLLAHGASNVRRPRCAHCDHTTPLTSISSNGKRICTPCAAKIRRDRNRCVKCGRQDYSWLRDRDGELRCQTCRPDPETDDPVGEICAVVARADPDLDATQVRQVVMETTRLRHKQLRLYWELDGRPDLLTGQGAQGSARVSALIDGLRRIGSQRILPPACPRCGRIQPLVPFQEQRVCHGCYRRANRATCVRCGRKRPVAGRNPDAEPLCGDCWVALPMNREICVRCGNHRAVSRRTGNGEPLCRSCYRSPIVTCSICREERHCLLSKSSSPRCARCSTTPQPCVNCGEVKQIVARTAAGRLCEPCYDRDPASHRTCIECGTIERLHGNGLCVGCTRDRRLLDLLDEPHDAMRPEVGKLRTALLADDPLSVLNWLRRSPAIDGVLTDLASGACTFSHEAIEKRLPGKVGAHFRAILVAAQALPPRDEHLAAIQHWVDTILTTVTNESDQRLIRTYVTWHHLAAIRRRNRGKPATANQTSWIQTCVRGAAALLNWVRASGTTLHSCTQRQLDDYLTSGPQCRYTGRHFLLWASARGHAGKNITIPVVTTKQRTLPTADDERWATARRLLLDNTIAVDRRVAGLLVLLYAQPLPEIVRLTMDHVVTGDGEVRLQLGSTPVVLPSPLNSLVTRLATERRGHASVGRVDAGPWLFPGGRPGQPVTASHLGIRLQRLGVEARPGRAAALLDLASQMPAAVIHQLLGVSLSTATYWTSQTGRSWSEYAAHVSHRVDPGIDEE